MSLLLGADPEVFVRKDGELVSAFGMVAGTKTNPHRVDGGAVQVDGMALEFNIDPASTQQEFVHSINHVMAQLGALVPDVKLSAEPVARFGKEYISAQPHEAKELGCEPDMNAWTEEENPTPDGETGFRTGAGHVHFGWTNGADIKGAKHSRMCSALMRQADFYLGLPSLFFDDEDSRRELYGKAGAYRPKSYGAEYRVLSNKWLTCDTLKSWVFEASRRCFESMRNGSLMDKYGDIQHVINTSDRQAASLILRRLVDDSDLVLPEGVVI